MRTPASWWMLLALSATIPRFASAQAEIALDRLNPTGPSSRLLAVADPAVSAWKLTPAAGALLSYADAPLVLVDRHRRELAAVVDHQLILHLQAAVQLRRRIEVGLNLPLVLSQSGETPIGAEPDIAPRSSTALGDLRVQGRVGVLDQHGALPAAGLLLSTWLPTGKEAEYASTRQIRMGMDVLLGADLGRVLWRASIGRRHQSEQALLPTAHSAWNMALGAAYLWNRWQLGAELYGATSADGRTIPFARRTNNLEAIFSLRHRWHEFWFTAGAGPGLASGAGTPHYRALFAVAFSPQSSHTEGSQFSQPDLVSGGAATSMRETGTARRDVTHAGVASPPALSTLSPDHEGPESMDSDRDGIANSKDACPNTAGPAHEAASSNGCPPDRDQDGIADAEDACPEVNGSGASDPKLNGCKSAVTIRGSQLVLTQQLHFRTGSDEILGESLQTLEQLRQLINESPNIARVAVDGHTDKVGSEARNLMLSRRRALAVVRWLIEHGVDERRLEARGFGPRQPLGTNQNEEGRAKNRRVEFNILRRTDRGPAGWKDGPVRD